MLTGFKVSSLVSKCKRAFYRPEHSALEIFNFEGPLECKYEINQQKRTPRVDKKMGPFVELSCLIPQLWPLK